MSTDQISAADLDELEDEPAAVAAPIDPAQSEDVSSAAPAGLEVDVDEDEASIDAFPEFESSDDEPSDDEIVLLNRELAVSNARVSRARAKYEAALAENSEINQRLGIALMAAGDVPLHVLNRMQDKITRPEDHRRLTAREAIDRLQGHYRPGKRNYPVHSTARPLVEKAE